MTKRDVAQWWGEMGLVTRAGAVLALIGTLWVGVTAAVSTTERWLWTRREQENFADSLTAAAVLHAVRDSARQENVYRALKYNACLTRTKGRDNACAHLATP